MRVLAIAHAWWHSLRLRLARNMQGFARVAPVTVCRNAERAHNDCTAGTVAQRQGGFFQPGPVRALAVLLRAVAEHALALFGAGIVLDARAGGAFVPHHGRACRPNCISARSASCRHWDRPRRRSWPRHRSCGPTAPVRPHGGLAADGGGFRQRVEDERDLGGVGRVIAPAFKRG